MSGATTSGQSVPGKDGNDRVLNISQNSNIIEASLSDCLMSYPRYSLGGGVLTLCRDTAVQTDWGIETEQSAYRA